MKKFEGWRTAELQCMASMLAGRNITRAYVVPDLYDELIREIRNRRVAQELFQMKLEGIEEE